VLAAGYADGIPHRLSNRGKVIVQGQLAPIIGAVSMDLTTIDVTSCAGLKAGDTVTLLGSEGGVSIDVRDMNQVLAVHAEDLDCVIQPGITRKALNEYLRDRGVFFPIDPGADASLGGMASTRASGTNAVRYGTMRDNVLALKVVRGDGEIITTGTRAKKSSAGYDLTHLFVGAEGTLGIISELTIKLRGIPETIAAAACSFDTVRGACQATILAIQTGIPVARI
jgi:D-lactate dehydrogenase (cytochrome)